MRFPRNHAVLASRESLEIMAIGGQVWSKCGQRKTKLPWARKGLPGELLLGAGCSQGKSVSCNHPSDALLEQCCDYTGPVRLTPGLCGPFPVSVQHCQFREGEAVQD